MHPALSIKASDCGFNLATRQLLNGQLQLRITLSNDLVECCRPHSGLLKLCEGPSCLDRLVLPSVSNKQHTVTPLQATEEFVHLAR
jgi:hypothetical protein